MKSVILRVETHIHTQGKGKMITFNKTPNKDFKILNLTDFQLMAPELNVEHEKGKIMQIGRASCRERV